jgi:hypothetical protein
LTATSFTETRLQVLRRHARAKARSASSRWMTRASTLFLLEAKTWMAGSSPAMTR